MHGYEHHVIIVAFILRQLLGESASMLHLEVQGEHKVFPWLQTSVTRKLRGIQTYFFL